MHACLLSYIWLHTPECGAYSEEKYIRLPLTCWHVTGAVQGKGQKPVLPGMTSQELFAAQNPNLPRPIQAQLHVMRAGFNRVSRPNMPDQPHLPAYSPPPITTGFPPAASEHHRGLLAPNHEPDIPRVASANSLQPSLISSSTRSSLPPSVASWLEQDHQQQRQQLPGRGHVGMTQQAGYGFGRELGPGQTVGSFPAANSGYGQHPQSGIPQGVLPLLPCSSQTAPSLLLLPSDLNCTAVLGRSMTAAVM